MRRPLPWRTSTNHSISRNAAPWTSCGTRSRQPRQQQATTGIAGESVLTLLPLSSRRRCGSCARMIRSGGSTTKSTTRRCSTPHDSPCRSILSFYASELVYLNILEFAIFLLHLFVHNVFVCVYCNFCLLAACM
jgi:hypothetical protein